MIHSRSQAQAATAKAEAARKRYMFALSRMYTSKTCKRACRHTEINANARPRFSRTSRLAIIDPEELPPTRWETSVTLQFISY